MILYKEDWNKYPTAIADTNTTNSSWIRTAALIKSMGIDNHFFMLSLLNPKLVGVDPFSDNLTIEQKTDIVLECTYNPWYFYREVLRVPSGSQKLRFRCNRAVLSLIWSFMSNIDVALIMPRQTGKSVTVDGLEIWLLCFGLKKDELFLFTKDTELRKRNIKRIKSTLSLLPRWLNPTCKKDLDNTEVVTMVAKGNLLKTAVGQQQKDRANNIGRGETLPFIHVDEGPTIPNVQISLPVLLAAGGAAKENAKLVNTPHGSIFTTTAGKKDTNEGAFFYDLVHSGMYWDERLYDCENKEVTRNMVMANKKGNRCVINATFSHRQIGLSDAWLLEKIAEAGGSLESINRDYYNRWTSGTISNPLSSKLIEVIVTSEIPPLYSNILSENYIMNWYIDEFDLERIMAEGHFIIGLDTSNAIGRDSNAIIITDIRDMSVIASCTISEANLHKYGIWLANFMIRYGNTTLIIENKSSAQGIIDTVSAILISAGIDPFKRMYNRVTDDHLIRTEDFKSISLPLHKRPEEVYLRFKGSIGFNTTGTKRSFLYDTVLQDAVKSTGHLIKDKNLSSELRSLVIKNGRVDHIDGFHDDSCIAWLLCHWFIKHSKNLIHYGIDPKMCLSLVSIDGATLSEEDLVKRKELTVVNMEINELKEKLISSPTIIQTMKYERLLANIISKGQKLGDSAITMDKIMTEVAEKKVSKRSLSKAVRRFNGLKRAA